MMMNTPNPNPSPELLPCPFCGSDNVAMYRPALSKLWAVHCDEACDFKGPTALDKPRAIAAWNTRALSQTLPAPGEVERLRAALTKAKQAARYVAVGDGYFDPYANHVEAVDAVVDAALSSSVSPVKPLATVAAANDEGDWVLVSREITQAMLDATCATDADDRAMRAAWPELIRTAPKPLATSRLQHEGASS